MAVGYYSPQLRLPAPLPAGSLAAPPGSFMAQAQQMGGPSVTEQGPVPYAQPADQGELTRLAYQMAGPPPQPSMIPGSTPAPTLPGMTAPTDILRGSSASGPGVSNKVSGAASGALAGWQVGGPWGAVIGGVGGYALGGGAKDLNPIDASGFSGIGMDRAWEDQNLARLGSNPAAAVASKAGISSSSVLGKALDPTSFLSGLFGNKHGDEKRNLSAFTKENQLTDLGNGMLALPNGAQFPASQLKDIAGTWYGATYHPDGDQAGWQQKYDALLSQLYSQPQPNIRPGG